MKLLDIYYSIDLSDNQDISFIEKCLEVYMKTKFQEYNIQKFEVFKPNLMSKGDIIQNGIDTFNEMFEKLKLKSSHDVWFFYISNGDIKHRYKDVSVVLLNKNPMDKKANYVINKTVIDVNLTYTKEQKLIGTKCLTTSLHHLFDNQDKIIEYQ